MSFRSRYYGIETTNYQLWKLISSKLTSNGNPTRQQGTEHQPSNGNPPR